MADELEALPGKMFITNGDILRYSRGEEFTVITESGTVRMIFPDSFEYYFEIWENYRLFGLPHGGGWIDELPWVVDFLKYFERIAAEIERFEMDERRRNWRQA